MYCTRLICLHFRAQMNCVPGMITEFAFIPTITTEEIRQNEDIKAKVKKINAIRRENSQALIAKGGTARTICLRLFVTL